MCLISKGHNGSLFSARKLKADEYESDNATAYYQFPDQSHSGRNFSFIEYLLYFLLSSYSDFCFLLILPRMPKRR